MNTIHIINEAFAPWVIPVVVGVAQGIKSLIQHGKGRAQAREAQRMAATPRPLRRVGKGYIQNVRDLETSSSMSRPGTGFLRSRIDRQIANSAALYGRYAGGSSILSGIGRSVSAGMDAEAKMAAEDTAYRESQKNLLRGARLNLENEKLAAWQWNEQQPYANAMQRSSQLIDAADRNKYEAIKGFVDIVPKALMAYSNLSRGGQSFSKIPSLPPPKEIPNTQAPQIPDQIQMPDNRITFMPDAQQPSSPATGVSGPIKDTINQYRSIYPELKGKNDYEALQWLQTRGIQF